MRMHNHQHNNRRPSSFWMQDAELVFSALSLNTGDVFADIGCGCGEYAIYASNQIGETGVVYALDKSETLISNLVQQISVEHITNLIPVVADITETLPVKSSSVDICLLATVLHIPEIARHTHTLCSEIHRILKPAGRLAVIECSMKDLSFGPPPDMRLSPDVLCSTITSSNFTKISELDIGFNYLLQFASR